MTTTDLTDPAPRRAKIAKALTDIAYDHGREIERVAPGPTSGNLLVVTLYELAAFIGPGDYPPPRDLAALLRRAADTLEAGK